MKTDLKIAGLFAGAAMLVLTGCGNRIDGSGKARNDLVSVPVDTPAPVASVRITTSNKNVTAQDIVWGLFQDARNVANVQAQGSFAGTLSDGFLIGGGSAADAKFRFKLNIHPGRPGSTLLNDLAKRETAEELISGRAVATVVQNNSVVHDQLNNPNAKCGFFVGDITDTVSGGFVGGLVVDNAGEDNVPDYLVMTVFPPLQYDAGNAEYFAGPAQYFAGPIIERKFTVSELKGSAKLEIGGDTRCSSGGGP